jgi:hypothetical protein
MFAITMGPWLAFLSVPLPLRLPHQLTLRQPSSPLRSAAPRACNAGVGGAGGGSIPSSRLGEFAFAGGDPQLQTALASELQWRVTTLSTAADIDESIARFGADVPAALDGLFGRKGADVFLADSDLLANQASFAHLALWNKGWREAYAVSGARRAQISEELAIVDKLLLARQRQTTKNKGRARRGKMRSVRANAVAGADCSSTNSNGGAGAGPLFGHIPVIAAIPTIGLLTTGCLKAFDSFIETNNPRALTQLSFFSLLVVAMVTHHSAMRHLAKKANKYWE